MKTVSHQTEVRSRFVYAPDRHYVKVQVPDQTWDDDACDRLLDQTDPATGAAAYRLEARGNDAHGRRITGSRRINLLSCSKTFAEQAARLSSNESQARARALAPQPQGQTESLKEGAPLTVDDVLGS